MNESVLIGGGRTEVIRRENTVLRKTGPWAQSVHGFLHYLEEQNFEGAPRVVGDGFDKKGREILTYIEGDFVHPLPWRDEGIIAAASLLKNIHVRGANYQVLDNAVWRPWFARSLQYSKTIIGHGDFAPWNLVSKNGIPFAAIDWENAGPVDALVEVSMLVGLMYNSVTTMLQNALVLVRLQNEQNS